MTKFSGLLGNNLVELIYRSRLHKALRADFEEAEAARKHQLHASLVDDDDWCVRRALLSMLGRGGDEYVPISRLLIFEDGLWRHKRWQSLLVKSGLAREEDIERTRSIPGLFALCTPDAIVEIDGEKYIWECKGMNQREFEKVKKSGKCPDRFVRRVHVYGAATAIRRAIIHIDDKGKTDEFLVFIIDLDRKMMGEVLRRLNELTLAFERYRKSKLLPEMCENVDCTCRKAS